MNWVVLLAAAGCYDVWLMATGRESLTACYKRNARIALPLTGYMLGHLTGLLPPATDVFEQSSRRVGRN